MNVEGRWRRSIELADDARSVIVLDQQKLPREIRWVRLATLDEVARAIKDMTVRGAPLIGVTAAYGVAISGDLERACDVLAKTRPTAINLRWALARMRELIGAGVEPFAAAAQLADEDVAQCEAIGRAGLPVLRDNINVLTHCNAGWLATVDWGTALAPIYHAHEAGLRVHVWVDETRPRNQGLLTAWELAQHGVPHTVIADNAGGHLMQRGEVDVVIVGTDRTTAGGDVCNKIGTYLKALAAHDNGIPFYAAVPVSSIDRSGAEIPIEERDPAELGVTGHPVRNPAFDITPARLVTGLITERGIVKQP